MFIIKYHKPKCKTKYYSKDGLKSNKDYATAFPESCREQAVKKFANCDIVQLVTINVSEVAETMYENHPVRVKDIAW